MQCISRKDKKPDDYVKQTHYHNIISSSVIALPHLVQTWASVRRFFSGHQHIFNSCVTKPIKYIQHLLLKGILKIILEVHGQEKGSLGDEQQISAGGDYYKGDEQKRDLRAEEKPTLRGCVCACGGMLECFLELQIQKPVLILSIFFFPKGNVLDP